MHDILQQILFFFGRGLCHQYPERSFEAGGLIFSVCARDTGIYVGFIVTLVVLAVLVANNKVKPAAMPPPWAIVVSVLLIVPMAVDGAGSYLGLHETNNLLRYLTGYLCGMGVAVLASGGFLSLCVQSSSTQSALSKPSRLSTVLVASSALGALFYLVYPYLGIVAPFLTLACQWLAFALVTALVISTTRIWAWSQEGTGSRRVFLLVLCLVLAGVELTLFSLLASGLGMLIPWYVHP